MENKILQALINGTLTAEDIKKHSTQELIEILDNKPKQPMFLCFIKDKDGTICHTGADRTPLTESEMEQYERDKQSGTKQVITISFNKP